MFSFGIILSCLAAGAHSQFLSPPTDLTTTKGFAGYDVRWKEVPTGPDGICELVRLPRTFNDPTEVPALFAEL